MTDFAGEIHPAALVFPMMAADELEALAEDIRERGLRDPIILDADGRLVDGRNRLEACRLAKVEPRFTHLNGVDALSEVISANVRRRKLLTVAQRAIAAAESWPLAGGRPKHGGGARGSDYLLTYAEMARRWEIGEASLKQATALVERNPDAATAVKTGASLEAAYQELLGRERRQRGEQSALDGLRARHRDLADLVATGDLTLQDALAAGRERDDRELEERRTRSQVLVALVSAGKPPEHAERYAETFDARHDPHGAVNPDALRSVARFATAVADHLERSRP